LFKQTILFVLTLTARRWRDVLTKSAQTCADFVHKGRKRKNSPLCPLGAPVFFWRYELTQSSASRTTERKPVMGLDMYAFITREDVPAVDFPDPADTAKLFYWRKHPNLHGWMERLYRAKGGKDEQFNLAPVRLDTADLDALEKVVRANALIETTGFFFGTSRPEERKLDIEFIHRARDAIASGKSVFYTSWW